MNRTAFLAAFALIVLSVGELKADLLVGPTAFTVVGSNDTSWGIQFTALDNSTLTAFDYNHNPSKFASPFTGTISLNDITSNANVYSTTYGPNAFGVISFTGLNVGLVAGDSYQLVATSDIHSGANDEVFSYGAPFSGLFAYPDSNSDISVTNGVFDKNPGFLEAVGWAAFNNIATTTKGIGITAVVPELPSSALFVPGIALLLGVAYASKRRKPLPA